MTQKTLAVYGDFNCPFCYALSELLLDAQLDDVFQWRTIEHIPGADCDAFTPEEQSLLASEVYNVRHRLPDLDIAIPPCRPNTAIANRLLLIVSQYLPEKAPLLRRLIYRSLWVEGNDISDASVLLALLPVINFDSPIDPDDLSQEQHLLQAWQHGWEDERFEGRIPVIMAEQRYLLGLALLEDIQHFLNGEEVSGDCALNCYVKPRQNIAILGELRSLWGFVGMLRHEYHIHLLQSETALWEQIQTDHLPDLVLIDADALKRHSLKLCERLKRDEATRPIPVMLVADHIDIDDEVKAYRLGVSDFMRRDRSPEVFKARVDMLLQLKVTRDELERAARRDSLTQIYNRREFDRVLLQEWRRCARSRTTLSLLMIDIDYFKDYNDHYGHLAGDGCIRMLAHSMKNAVERTSDLVCRYGGEEFAILLPDTCAKGALKVAHNLKRCIDELNIAHVVSEVSEHVTVSIGCCTLRPDTAGDMLKLVSIADQRLYLAKKRGRNCIVGDENA